MRKIKLFIDKLNKISQEYKSLIEVLGILFGLILLFLTLWSTLISRDLLQLSQQQEYNKQLPIWDFEINDSNSVIKLKPFTQDIKIQRADFFYPKDFMDKSEWAIDPPEFKMYVYMFKFTMNELCKQRINYNDTNYIHLSFRNEFPIGLEVNYIQYGESRTVYGIYYFQYLLTQKNFHPEIHIEGVLFDRYSNKKDLLDYLEIAGREMKEELKRSDTLNLNSR